MPAIDTQYVDQAERVIRGLPTNHRGDYYLTTNQLRNLLSLTAQIFDEAQQLQGDELPKGLLDKVRYLRVRFVYQAGRESAVMAFVKQAKLLEALAEIGESRERLIEFCRYMEALVAYKKYLDPRESTRSSR